MWRAVLLAVLLIPGDSVSDEPARLRLGTTPTELPRLAGQCTLLFALDVDPAGVVAQVSALCREPLLTTLFTHSIRRWRFEPATRAGAPAASRVLVAVMLRPPVLMNVGPCEEPLPGVCAVPTGLLEPTALVTPGYPPQALGDGIVVVEVEVDAGGRVARARPIGRSTAFDLAAVEAAHGWRFRPALVDGVPTGTLAYLVFGFEEPALAPLPQ